ncbi:hypothetical protein ACFV1N_47430 [Streptosporangium canum]|uniref:hypothetical protein n=1 Tax=Streptosporangium canum TaxID=324952 RepID=UPI00367C4F54
MSKEVNLVEAAAAFADSNTTSSHQAYRDYLETLRSMACQMALIMTEDSREIAKWLRDRRVAPDGRRVPWLTRIWLAARIRGHGETAALAFLELAKAAVRMAAVHEEYLMAERMANKTTNGKRQGRYETTEGP